MSNIARITAGVFLCLSIIVFFGIASAAGVDYGDRNNWAYAGGETGWTHDVDVFFVCPTVFLGRDGQYNMPVGDAEMRKNFRGATNMEKGIYDRQANFYAPYYRQAALTVYRLGADEAGPYFELAYQDVRDAFHHYLKHHNSGRPIVLAGFSQGADMVVRLMKDVFSEAVLRDRLVAAYAIGWRVTPDELKRYPHLKMARGERDTGVIISFNTEAPDIRSSVLVPDRTLGINPLNWKTTDEHAGRSLNKGGVFTGYDGKIAREVAHLTGAYLDAGRGTLKVTDISPVDYPPVLDIFSYGVYHVYDYMFFYRNLQDNVRDRIEAFRARELKTAS